MIRVGITGIEGLIGWHLAAFLHGVDGAEVIGANREAFASPESLAAFAGRCDAIVHLAGMNRGDDEELRETNVALAQAVVDACDAAAVMTTSGTMAVAPSNWVRASCAASRCGRRTQWAPDAEGLGVRGGELVFLIT